MKRVLILFMIGLALAGAGYGVLWAARTASLRHLEQSCGPELAWLKTEYNLDEASFERVRVLHEAYKPVCAEYCRQIDEQHQRLGQLLETSQGVTPEMEEVVATANRLRAVCQTEMLKHFFEVSRAMAPEQGRRYLEWMHRQTLSPSHSTMLPQVGTSGAPHGQHVH